MSAKLAELRDYESLRDQREPLVERFEVAFSMLVLGSAQNLDVLSPLVPQAMPVRRRRGGGGVVLLRPRDLWIDVWIPRGHEQWTSDVRDQSTRVGRWWLDALEAHEVADLSQYVAGTNDEVSMSVACFANSSPGEVVSPAGKVVGLTQWRPREGALVSGVLTYLDSRDLARMVVGPSELVTQLQHPSQSSLDLATSVDGISRLVARHLDVAVTPRALS